VEAGFGCKSRVARLRKRAHLAHRLLDPGVVVPPAGGDVILQALAGVGHVAEQLEEADEVGLARAVGADEDVEPARQGKVHQLANRLVAEEGDPLEGDPVGEHGPESLAG